ncbi:MAG: DegV family EDD domain-containing protein [Chloroflexi bacterium]|nr:DegV family EDD domain-containing protein [Chloroflexota bacterium]
MPNVAVVTDSTADFSHAAPAELGVVVLPLTVNWGRDVLRDGVDITPSEFCTRLRVDPDVPHTAAPPLGIFEEVYRNLLATHDAVISIHISSRLSATHGVASTAAKSVDPRRVYVVDSLTVSIDLAWLVQRAAEMARAGASAEDILPALSAMIPRMRICVTLDTLEYLHRGGRIGKAQAFLGGLLNVKPIVHVLDGEVHPLERVRTRAASLRRIAELAQAVGPKELVAVAHVDCEEEARTLAENVARREGLSTVPVAELGAVLATHCGPGLLGFGCLLADAGR